MSVHLGLRPWLGCVFGLGLLVVLTPAGAGGAEPASKSKPLTAAQQARLKERDRLAAEAEKLGEANQLAEMVAAWEKKIAIEREVFGNVHEEVALSYTELARMQELRGDFAAAGKARREALAIRLQLHGTKDWRVADARRKLDNTERLSKRTPQDRQRLRQATALSRQVESLWQWGRSRDALPLARRALETHRAILGEAHPDYATSLNNLAELYQDMGDHRKALPLLEQARDIDKQTLGEAHPDYATSLNSLARL